MSSPNIPAPSQNGSSRVTTRLLATGFNAHSQLSPDTTSDIYSFIPICETTASDLQVLFSGWSQTLITASGGLLCLGHDHEKVKTSLPKGSDHNIKAAIGDHNGLLLTLSQTGEAQIINNSSNKSNDQDSPKIEHIALARNGRIALTYLQAPTAQSCHILQFASFSHFQTWLQKNPCRSGNDPDSHHMLPGRPSRLLANTGVFMLLMEGGEVYTWGDARYGSLGRAASTASEPGIVEALDGLKIRKIATSGWICSALSEDGVAYIWGTMTPGTKAKIKPLRGEEGEDVTMVEIFGGVEGEVLDVVDVGVGDDHVAVVVEGKRLFVVGQNKNGQLGLEDSGRREDWREVELPGGFEAVWCGPLATFVSVLTE